MAYTGHGAEDVPVFSKEDRNEVALDWSERKHWSKLQLTLKKNLKTRRQRQLSEAFLN